MKITVQQYAQSLREALEEASPNDHDAILDKFTAILSKNGDFGMFESIAAEFEKLSLQKQGISQGQITTAMEMKMDGALLDRLNQAAGQKLQLKTRVDRNLIGGLVLRVDDTLLDASLKGQLSNLKNSLSK